MKIKLFSKNNCPKCVQIKSILEQIEKNHIGKFSTYYVDTIYVDSSDENKELMFKMFEDAGLTKPSSVPQMFVSLDDENYSLMGIKELVNYVNDLPGA